ncbi:MAG: TldD/PmbA family protein, partial [Bryobacteraceae bacterium]|nr:TldD/PmbA family protein [Bryobacteraceae bacterium]
ILPPPVALGEFVSLLTEGRDVLAGAAVQFADARLDAVRTVRHSLDESGRVQSRDGYHLGLGVRVIDRGGCGFSAIEGEMSWDQALARASALAHAMSSGNDSGACLALVDPLDEVEATEQNIALPTPQRLAEVRELVRQAIPQAESVRVAYLGRVGWRGVVTTEGTRAVRPMTYSSLSVTCPVRCAGGVLVPLSITDRTVGPDDVVQKALSQLDSARRLAEQLTTAEVLRPRQCPVVLGPALAGLLIHEAFGHLCEADRVPRSRIAALPRGLVVGPAELEVWDRADVPGACGSRAFDDEGVRCRAVPLVSRGRWVGLLHSRSTALLHGELPTGNALAISFRHAPLCRMRLTEVRAGSCDPVALLADIHDGVYLDIPHGGHIRGARFRLGAIDARRILRGKLASPFAGVAIEGDPLAILNQIEAIGNDQMLIDRCGECSREDQRDLPVSTSAPSIRLREASLCSL